MQPLNARVVHDKRQMELRCRIGIKQVWHSLARPHPLILLGHPHPLILLAAYHLHYYSQMLLPHPLKSKMHLQAPVMHSTAAASAVAVHSQAVVPPESTCTCCPLHRPSVISYACTHLHMPNVNNKRPLSIAYARCSQVRPCGLVRLCILNPLASTCCT